MVDIKNVPIDYDKIFENQRKRHEESKRIALNRVVYETMLAFNMSVETVIDYLASMGIDVKVKMR